MKTFVALFAFTISSAFASQKKWPDVPYTHVVAYCYDFSQDKRGSSISFPDGSLNMGVIKATSIRLSDADTKNLLKILNDDVQHVRGEVECYDPHHGFVFYDSEWKIVASIDICFMCENHVARPNKPSESFDLRALEAFCRKIGLPVHEDSKNYTKLYEQEQPTRESIEKDQRKPSELDNVDPFAGKE